MQKRKPWERGRVQRMLLSDNNNNKNEKKNKRGNTSPNFFRGNMSTKSKGLMATFLTQSVRSVWLYFVVNFWAPSPYPSKILKGSKILAITSTPEGEAGQR